MSMKRKNIRYYMAYLFVTIGIILELIADSFYMLVSWLVGKDEEEY